MNQSLEKILDRIKAFRGSKCRLVQLRKLAQYDSPGGMPEIRVPAGELSCEWYVSIPGALRDAGIETVELVSWGWWLGEEVEGGIVDGRLMVRYALRVVDHVACRLPSPLTGSEAARHGKAFVDMRGAYDSGSDVRGTEEREGRMERDVVVWHTAEVKELVWEEIDAGRRAGCDVASPDVAPWAVGSRAAGCRIGAWICELVELQQGGVEGADAQKDGP